MSTYTHLTQEERYHIETLRKQKVSLSKIAAGMGRHKSTVSRELRRNQGQRGYRYQQAQRKALQRHQEKPKAVKLNDGLRGEIACALSNAGAQSRSAGA